MEAITESALAEFVANGAVKSITIRETPDGFETLVHMIWDESRATRVVIQKTKKPKYWSSLDRLVQHLSRLEPLPEIKVEVTRATQHAKARTGRNSAG